MAAHDVKRLILIDLFNISCVIMIIQSEWLLVFHTKTNLNTMLEINLCLLKALNESTLIHINSLIYVLYQLTHHGILCFNPFFSDDIKKDDATTDSHKKELLNS